MQLIMKKSTKVKLGISAAACALLGAQSPVMAEGNSNGSDKWQFDTAMLYYGETDRVTAVEAMINGKKEFADEHFLNLRLTLDTLTGASANGAIVQPNVQTFTRPSGKGQYQIKPGDTPLDDTFRDTRVQLNAQWSQPISPDYKISTGLHLSKEYDYLSVGVNGNVAFDFNNNNTTLSAGGSYFYDTFSPEGGIPVAFASHLIGDSESSSWDDLFADTRLTDEDTKTTSDILFGVTQVINRRMLMQLNYSMSVVDGYLTDPFKVLSVLDTGGIAQDYLYENRPDQRTKHSVFVQTKYHFTSQILDLSYRYMWDDWEIKSHTLDSRLRFPLTENSFLEPHVRFYQQEAAEFYQPYLVENRPLPVYASADYRIGEMTAYTVGLKYGMQLENGHDIGFRLEYYSQTPDDSAFEKPSGLAGLNTNEKINAVIFQVNYSF